MTDQIGPGPVEQAAADDETQIAPGGGVYYGSVALRRLGGDVAVVTRLHP